MAYENLRAALEMADNTAKQVTSNYSEWTSFLTTASRLYKYPFPEQLMIYAQRPDATACAEWDFWNQRMRRYIRRGSKGIALIDNSQGRPVLRYVFDVADTGQKDDKGLDPNLWQYRAEHHEVVTAALESRFEVPAGASLAGQLEQIAAQLAREYWNDHHYDICRIAALVELSARLLGLGAGYKVELIQIFRQTADGICSRCSRHQRHCVQLLDLLPRQQLYTLAHPVELGNIISAQVFQIQFVRYDIRQFVEVEAHLCVMRRIDTSAKQRPLNLLCCGGEIQVFWILHFCKSLLGCDRQHHETIVIGTRGKLMPVVVLLQHHAVVVDHAIGGNHPTAALDEPEGLCFTIYRLVLVHRHPTAVQRHDVVLPDLLQIGEAGNHRGLLTAKGEIDKIL